MAIAITRLTTSTEINGVINGEITDGVTIGVTEDLITMEEDLETATLMATVDHHGVTHTVLLLPDQVLLTEMFIMDQEEEVRVLHRVVLLEQVETLLHQAEMLQEQTRLIEQVQ